MTTVQPRSRAEAKMLGLPDWEIDKMFPAMDIEEQHDFNAQPQGGLLSPATPQQQVLTDEGPERPKSFWQGGQKLGGRDILSGLLAVIGDSLVQQGGGKGSAVDGLLGARTKGISAYEEAMKAYKRRQQVASLPGMTARELLAFDADPKAWGGHMADALSTHHAAANVNPGEQRVFGNPNAGGRLYQAPTAAEQYAASLGNAPRTKGYNTALQDYVLRGSGPTAYGYDAALDDRRTANDISLEGVRQANRLGLRRTPTYRDSNPPPPRTGNPPRRKATPTATGPNGEKIMWNGKSWVPAR